jgi:hypothetical protein
VTQRAIATFLVFVRVSVWKSLIVSVAVMVSVKVTCLKGSVVSVMEAVVAVEVIKAALYCCPITIVKARMTKRTEGTINTIM